MALLKKKKNTLDIIEKVNQGMHLSEEEYQEFLKFFKINYNPPKLSDLPIKENIEYDDNVNMNDIDKKLTNLEKDTLFLKKDIEWLSKTVLPAIIGLGAILLTAMIFGFTSQTTQQNANMDSINKSIQAINQRLDDQYKYIDAKTEKK